MTYKNILLIPTNFRSLAELSYELTKNPKHLSYKLREYRNAKETKYKKNKYPSDKAKTKQSIPEVTENETIGTVNINKYRKGTYNNEKEEKSNISARFIKYLEMQKKLYNNFYVKP